MWKEYLTPTTVDEALAALAQYEGAARVVAGGTDLLVEGKADVHGHHAAYPALVDVTRIPEMTSITSSHNGVVTIGAAVTHTTIVKSRALEQFATCLVESCGVIGGPQVRNVATIGGNVAHALPAGDGTTSLVALDAQVLVAWGETGKREWLSITEAFAGPGVSKLDSGRDVLVAVRFYGTKAGQGTAFQRVMRPQGVALPVLGCAVWVEVADGVYTDARVCLAPVAKTPIRASEVENALRGQPADEGALDKAVQAAHDSLKPRTSKYRATAEYRHHMIEHLLRGALSRAVERAVTGKAVAQGVGLG